MGVKFSRFKADVDKREHGTWIDIGAGFEVKIAKIGNLAYKDYVRTHGQHLSPIIRSGLAVDSEEMRTLTIKAVARHVLLDWKNLVDDNEEPIPYSVAKAEELLTDSEEFYEIITTIAGDHATFRARDTKEAAGNS